MDETPINRTPTEYAELNGVLVDLTERAMEILGENFVGAYLEGSYPLARELKTLGGLGQEWPYIDHGSRVLELSTHCNTEVTRWSLRECGIAITGPDPRSLVEEVPLSCCGTRWVSTR